MSRRCRNKTFFEESLEDNSRAYHHYSDQLLELSMSMFEWSGLPETVDQRFLELSLLTQGNCLFFKDDVIGYLALRSADNGPFDVYNIPVNRRAYASNGYQNSLDSTNSVLIYNNYLHTNSISSIRMYAKQLYDLDRIIMVNARAQKTPVLINCDETQRLTMLNLYKEFDGNAPVIFGNKGLNAQQMSCIRTDAPYVADKLYGLKAMIWSEALTYLGINKVNTTKRERMLSTEVENAQGDSIASRYGRLESRRQACIKINKMFGLDIWCDYREDLETEQSEGKKAQELEVEEGE